MKLPLINSEIIGETTFPDKTSTDGILVKQDGEIKPVVLSDGLIVINNGIISTVTK